MVKIRNQFHRPLTPGAQDASTPAKTREHENYLSNKGNTP